MKNKLLLTFLIFIQFNLIGNVNSQNVINIENQTGGPVILNKININLENEFPKIVSPYWIAIDVASQAIIGGKNIEAKIYPASMTKVLTAYIIFTALKDGRIKKEQKVKTIKNVEGSTMFLNNKDEVTVNDLIYGMIVQSGNDASINLAIASYGSENAFAVAMNNTAKKLGMLNSNFVNASGLPDENHYTTLHDLGVLALAIIRDFPEYYSLYSQKSYTYGGITQNNRNALLFRNIGVDGIKTGHTEVAGFCLMVSAIRGERRIVTITAKADIEADRFSDNQELINFVYAQTKNVKIYDSLTKADSLQVWKGDKDSVDVGFKAPLYLTIPIGKQSSIQAHVVYQQPILAPIKFGDNLAMLKVTVDNKDYADYRLVALTEVESAPWYRLLWHNLRLLFR